MSSLENVKLPVLVEIYCSTEERSAIYSTRERERTKVRATERENADMSFKCQPTFPKRAILLKIFRNSIKYVA